MIEIIGVKKSFGSQEVLKGLSLVAKNETVGLLGANGSGKTTLLKSLLGLLDFEGTIRIGGYDVRTQPLEAKRNIGYIPQHFPLLGDLSVIEAMSFAAQLRQVEARRQDELLAEFQLTAHAAKPVAALSGGMRQKLSIAIALLSDPAVILLDEPTASLDAWATNEILKILESWRGRKTVILSSHRLEEVRAVSHRLVQIRDGRLVEPSAEALARVVSLVGLEEVSCVRRS